MRSKLRASLVALCIALACVVIDADTQVASDDFNRVDSVSLGSNWTVPASCDAMAVSANKAQGHTGSAVFSCDWWNANAFANDQYCQFTIGGVGSASYMLCGVRHATGGAATAYVGGVYNGTYVIRKMTDSATIASLSADSLGSPSNGDLILFKVTGASPAHLVLTVNGGGGGSADDSSSPYTSGAVSLVAYSATYSADDWSGGDVSGATVTCRGSLLLLGAGGCDDDLIDLTDWIAWEGIATSQPRQHQQGQRQGDHRADRRGLHQRTPLVTSQKPGLHGTEPMPSVAEVSR